MQVMHDVVDFRWGYWKVCKRVDFSTVLVRTQRQRARYFFLFPLAHSEMKNVLRVLAELIGPPLLMI